jgi:hypothetical protein
MLGNLCVYPTGKTYNFGMQQLEYKFVLGNAQQPVNPAVKTFNFGMQQLVENNFAVGNARQPVNPPGKTYNFGMIFRNPQRETSNTQVRS